MAGTYDFSIIISAVDNVSKTLEGVGRSMLGVSNTMLNVSNAMAKLGAVASLQFTVPAGLMVRQAMAWEDQMNSLASVFHGTKEELDAVAKSATHLGETMPGTAEDFLKLYEAVNRANVPIKEQGELVRILAEHASTIGQTPEELSKFALELKSSLHLSNDELKQQLDLLNTLQSHAGPGATQALEDMLLQMTRLGQAMGGKEGGGQAVLALEQMSAAMARMGVMPRKVASGFTEMFANLSNIKGPSKELAWSLHTMGMGLAQVQHGLEHDTANTLIKMLTSISKLDPGKQRAAISSIWGPQMVGPLMALVKNLPEFQKLIKDTGNAQANAADQAKSWSRNSQAAAEQIRNMWDALKDLGRVMGEEMVSRAGPWAKSIQEMVTSFRETHPELIKSFADALGVLALLGPGLVTAAGALQGLSLAITLIGGAVGKLPSMLVLAVLADGLYQVYQNWDLVGPSFDKMTKAFGDLLGAANGLAGLPAGSIDIAAWFKGDKDFAKDIATLFEQIADSMTKLKAALENPPDFSKWSQFFGSFGSGKGNILPGADWLQKNAPSVSSAIVPGAGALSYGAGLLSAPPSPPAPPRIPNPGGGRFGPGFQGFGGISPLIRDSSSPAGNNQPVEVKGKINAQINLALPPGMSVSGMNVQSSGHVSTDVGFSSNDVPTRP